MLTIPVLIVVAALVGLAYQLLPYRFGLPVLAILVAGVAVLLVQLGNGGYADGEYEQSGLLMMAALVGVLLGSAAAPLVRRRNQPVSS